MSDIKSTRYTISKPDKANFNDAKYFYKLRLYSQALEILNRLLEEEEVEQNDIEKYKLYIGKCYFEQEKFQEAIEIFKGIIESNPNNLYAYMELGRANIRIHNYEEAISVFQIYNSLEEKGYLGYYELGRIALKLGEYNEARGYLKIALKNSSNDLRAIFRIGKIYRQYKLYGDAIEVFTQYLSLINSPEIKSSNFYISTVYQERGKCYAGIKKYDLAIKDFTESLKCSKSEKYVFFEIAKVYQAKREFDNSIKYFLKCIEINPNDKKAIFELGDTYLKMGDLNNAEKYYTKCLAISERNGESEIKNNYTFFGLARVYVRRKKYDIAKVYFGKSIELDPENSYAFLELGKMYVLMGEDELAAEQFDKCIELNDNDSAAHLERGKYYKRIGNFELARKEFKKCIRINKFDTHAFLELGILESMINNDEKAMSFYKSYLTDLDDAKLSPFNVISRHIEDNGNSENSSFFYKANFKDTLSHIKDDIESGHYILCRGYGFDFYILEIEGCGYSTTNDGSKNELNCVTVCTYPQTSIITTILPIEGRKELGKQSDNIVYTTQNLGEVVYNDSLNLDQETILIRNKITAEIKKIMDEASLRKD